MGKRAMLALIGIGMVSLMGCNGESMLEPEQATADGREVVVVDGASPVVLDVRNGVGTITLRGAESEDAHEIAVAYTLTAYAATKAQAEREVAAMTVTVTQEDGRVQVNAVQTQFRDHPRTNKVDLTISVPPSIDLVLRNAVGDVDVRACKRHAVSISRRTWGTSCSTTWSPRRSRGWPGRWATSRLRGRSPRRAAPA